MKNSDLLKELVVNLGLKVDPGGFLNNPGGYSCVKAVVDEWYYLRFFLYGVNQPVLTCYADPRRARYNKMSDTWGQNMSTVVFSVNLTDPSSLDVVKSMVDRWLKSHTLILAACDGELWS